MAISSFCFSGKFGRMGADGFFDHLCPFLCHVVGCFSGGFVMKLAPIFPPL